MKKPKNAIEGEGIIIKMGGKYRFIMRIGKILQPLPGKELVRVRGKAGNLTELRSRLKETAKKRAQELGIQTHIFNLDPEFFYS